jgi:DNA-binding NarL/FixJ family response regulator
LTGAFADCENLADNIKTSIPDIILMDIEFEGEPRGLFALEEIMKEFPNIKVIMLTSHDENELVFECLCKGAWGYIIKGTPYLNMRESIEEVRKGGAVFSPTVGIKVRDFFTTAIPTNDEEFNLTAREKESLNHLCNGLSKKMIADKMGISLEGVSQHLRHVFEKLHVHTATEAVSKAFRNRVVPFKFKR